MRKEGCLASGGGELGFPVFKRFVGVGCELCGGVARLSGVDAGDRVGG